MPWFPPPTKTISLATTVADGTAFVSVGKPRKVTARYRSTEGRWRLGRDAPRSGSSPEGYVCQTLFERLYFFFFSKYTVYLQL